MSYFQKCGMYFLIYIFSLHALPNVVGNCVMEHLIASQEHFSWIIANLMRILALYLHILVYVSDFLMTMTKTKTDTFLNQNQYFPPKNFPSSFFQIFFFHISLITNSHSFLCLVQVIYLKSVEIVFFGKKYWI